MSNRFIGVFVVSAMTSMMSASACPTTVPGQRALSFSGGLAVVPDSPSLTLGTSATIELWMRSQSDDQEVRVLEKGDGQVCWSDRSFEVGLNPTWLQGTGNTQTWWFFQPDCPLIATTGTWQTGQWTHLAFTIDTVAGVQNAYANGILVATSAVPAEQRNRPLGDSTHPLVIGGSDTFGLRFTGEMDELRIWHTARSPAQIAAFMRTVVDPTSSDLAAYYRFEERMGLVITDLSSGANHGQLQGSVSRIQVDTCLADFDCSHQVEINDIFAYLNAWFRTDMIAEVSGDGQLSVLDIFWFLNEWFAGC